MKNIRRDINLVLSGWNPIGVPGHVALSEYSQYVPSVIKAIENDHLIAYLETLLSDLLELEYDPNNQQQAMELKNISGLLRCVYEGKNAVRRVRGY